jgi:DNA-binding LacI/PurR family transcriptional regulator
LPEPRCRCADFGRRFADLLRFPVTTVAQDVDTIGHAAFGMLMELRDGRTATGGVLVPPRLIVR